jgi:hypothetical protein
MGEQESRHVFISYVRENQELVGRLCENLKAHGVNVWLDRNSINPGARWKAAIREAIRHGDFFIACFSDAYTSKVKTYMNEELTLAIEELRQYASDREWFIPVLLSECDVPARSLGGGKTLLDINWVPLYEDWDAGVQRIISVIKPVPPRVQTLIAALGDEDEKVREHASEALGEIGLEAVPALAEALKNKDAEFRWWAAKTLREIGSEAKDVVPTFIQALNDKDRWVRWVAMQALWIINSPEARKALEEYEKKSD